ncbi:MAG: hypothetical protein QW478_05795, partial [Candidatus Micrarchaeaceae archaeon]
TFQVILLQQTYWLFYVNKTIYYTVSIASDPSYAGGIYYMVNGQAYYTSGSFIANTEITFYAYTNSQYFAFSYFTGTIPGSSGDYYPLSVKLTGNDTEIAYFSNLYYFHLTINGYGVVSVTVDYTNGTVVTKEGNYSTAPVSLFPIEPGSTIKMVATPLYGSSFSGYSGSYSSSSTSYTITINSNVSEVATFTGGHPPESLTVIVNGSGTAYIDKTPTSSELTMTVPQGTLVTFMESPGPNYEFVSYTGYYGSSTDTTLNVFVNSSGVEYVNFQPISVSLTVIISPSSGGYAIVDGYNDTQPSYTISVQYGSSVSIKEESAPGYTFAKFYGYYNSTSNSINFTMESNGKEYVSFSQIYVTLSVSVSGDGTVYVAWSNGNQSTTSSYSLTIPWGSSVTLTSYASPDYYFADYSGVYGYSSYHVFQITVEQSGTEYVYFDIIEYQVTIIVNPENVAGTVSWSGAVSGHTNSFDSFYVPANSVIWLNETSFSGYTFYDYNGTYGTVFGTSMRINVTQSGTEYVNFNQIVIQEYQVTIIVDPSGAGTASWSGAASGSTSSSSGPFSVPAGSIITISENPSNGYMFSNYSGTFGSSSISPYTITVNQDGTEYVNFISKYVTLTVEVNPSGDGLVENSNGSIFTYSIKSVSILRGTSVTLKAFNTATGWAFNSFTGDFANSTYAQGGASVTFTVDSSGIEYVNFVSNVHYFDVIINQAGWGTATLVVGGNQVTVYNNTNVTYNGASTYVDLYETPNSGYSFSSYSGYYPSTSSSVDFTLYGSGTEYVNFVKHSPAYYQVTIIVTPSGGGTASWLGAASGSTTSSDTFNVPANGSITLGETPSNGYMFNGYSGTFGSPPGYSMTFTVNQNGIEYVNFAQDSITYTLTVDVSPNNGGVVYVFANGNEEGEISTSASFPLPANSEIYLSESPGLSYTWVGFTGMAISYSTTVTFNLTFSGIETANFQAQSQSEPTYYTLTVTTSNKHYGYVYFYYGGSYYNTSYSGSVSVSVLANSSITLYAKAFGPTDDLWHQFVYFTGTFGKFPMWEDPVTITVDKTGYEEGVFTETAHNISTIAIGSTLNNTTENIIMNINNSKGDFAFYYNMVAFEISYDVKRMYSQ